jgi:uncharacterized protein DUF3383
MPAIPASQIVSVVPSVIGAGGSALDLNGLILTANPRVPIGTVQSFPSAPAVTAYFGATSQEAMLANIYFLGFDGSTVKPGALLFAQYPLAPVGAWLRGGNISSMTLAVLQALSGSLQITIDGVVKTASTISLAGATSFSAAAALIATGLGLTPLPGASITASITGTVMNVTAVVPGGTVAAGQTVSGGMVAGGTTVGPQLTGTPGGIGTYTVSPSQTVTSGALTTTFPPVSFDPISGAFQINSSTTGPTSTIGFASGTLASPLLLTQANGAQTSQGAPIGVPSTNMNAIIGITQDWASFMTAFNPGAAGLAFAAWNNAQGNDYAYVHWTTDAAATVVPDTTTTGAQIQAANYSGTILVYEAGTQGDKAAFEMGYIASLDFGATNGRATAMFRGQSGLTADVLDGTTSANLRANGYNFYGDWSTANDDFIFFANGTVTGPFQWIDSYVNQIWMNNQFQLALMSLLVAVKSIPYNAVGYAMIRAACLDVIIAAVNFGAIRAGVSLSQAQAAEVNFAAGIKIDDVLGTRGWYLQILDPTAQVRGQRGTPQCSFWYMDGESVQRINLASIEVQ